MLDGTIIAEGITISMSDPASWVIGKTT